jgi:RND family efflux transporter MFP subunit
MKVFVVLLAVSSSLLAAGCRPRQAAPQGPVVVRVAVAMAAEEASLAPRSEYLALLRGETETELSFKIGGVLDLIGRENSREDWQEGTAVKKGEVLAMLKQTDFIAAEQAARAKRDLDDSLYGRIKELREKGATSAQEYDVAKANMDSSRAAWAQAQQALLDSVIRAPYDGTILARLVNPGETISPGSPILKMANLQNMSAELGVPEKLVGSIQIGKEIPVRISALEGQPFIGRISEVGVAAKEGARLFKVIIKLDNPDGRIKSGMTASVVLSPPPSVPPGSVLVPLSALVGSSGTNTARPLAVFVVDADGRAREQAVTTDEIVRSSIVITSGLRPGDRVVTAGASALYDGAPVEVRSGTNFESL